MCNLRIMKSGCAFYNLEELNSLQDAIAFHKLLKANYFVIHNEWSNVHIKWDDMIFRTGESFAVPNCPPLKIVKLNTFETDIQQKIKSTISAFEYAYAIKTSGTTGSPKFILVPHKCIVPNITDFINTRWNMEQSDVVLGTSPISFDPHIVELFVGLGSGASILYVPKKVKLVGAKLSKLCRKHKVSVIQITPSLLRHIGNDLKLDNFFNPTKSHLKVLAIGGEKCLSQETLRFLIDEEMFKSMRKLQNLYGITEVSCWASVFDIPLYKTDNNGTAIPLGEAIVETTMFLKNSSGDIVNIPNSSLDATEGEILIGTLTFFLTMEERGILSNAV